MEDSRRVLEEEVMDEMRKVRDLFATMVEHLDIILTSKISEETPTELITRTTRTLRVIQGDAVLSGVYLLLLLVASSFNPEAVAEAAIRDGIITRDEWEARDA